MLLELHLGASSTSVGSGRASGASSGQNARPSAKGGGVISRLRFGVRCVTAKRPSQPTNVLSPGPAGPPPVRIVTPLSTATAKRTGIPQALPVSRRKPTRKVEPTVTSVDLGTATRPPTTVPFVDWDSGKMDPIVLMANTNKEDEGDQERGRN